mmetsp:Transcript_43284/g.109308  ORF Transcript_43284/g.109308 Transcript_43284/m.109308 type:complete len:247 (+) Transcript_43284:2035-2775(+)
MRATYAFATGALSEPLSVMSRSEVKSVDPNMFKLGTVASFPPPSLMMHRRAQSRKSSIMTFSRTKKDMSRTCTSCTTFPLSAAIIPLNPCAHVKAPGRLTDFMTPSKSMVAPLFRPMPGGSAPSISSRKCASIDARSSLYVSGAFSCPVTMTWGAALRAVSRASAPRSSLSTSSNGKKYSSASAFALTLSSKLERVFLAVLDTFDTTSGAFSRKPGVWLIRSTASAIRSSIVLLSLLNAVNIRSSG